MTEPRKDNAPEKGPGASPLDNAARSAERDDGPALAQTDWDDIGARGMDPTQAPSNGDLRYSQGPSGELPEEDDDNEYQESDEVLPDDEEERALDRDPSKEGSRFDEV